MKSIIKLILLLILLIGVSCSKKTAFNNYEYSDLVEGYIVGSFKCFLVEDGIVVVEDCIYISTERGFLISLQNEADVVQNPTDFIYTFSIPENTFDFPEEIFGFYDVNNCVPVLFPDSLKQTYKIRFKYRIVEDNEKITFGCIPCLTMDAPFNWENYNQVI